VRSIRGQLALLVLLAAALPASAGAAPAVVPRDSVSVSDELTVTRWATPYEVAPIRTAPDPRARRIGRLRLWTEDGYPEVYVVLRTYATGDSDWLLLRLPQRPHGSVGWAPADSLSPLGTVRTRLTIDRRRLVAVLYRDGRPVWRSPVGVGKASTPTPAGRFWIREEMRTGNPGGPYGPWALGTSAYSNLSDWPGGGVVGIHGTNQPELVPGRPSHGCVRMPNAAIASLVRLAGVGTPIWVS
jgi:lipoprotein-anchoring transpeptidase ErfK/SrfK